MFAIFEYSKRNFNNTAGGKAAEIEIGNLPVEWSIVPQNDHLLARINDFRLTNNCSSSKNKKSRQEQHFVSFMAARLSPVCNNKRRPVAFRPVLADRFGFSVLKLAAIIILLWNLSSFFFGVDTSGTIALPKIPEAAWLSILGEKRTYNIRDTQSSVVSVQALFNHRQATFQLALMKCHITHCR